jgi:hypothetical protein
VRWSLSVKLFGAANKQSVFASTYLAMILFSLILFVLFFGTVCALVLIGLGAILLTWLKLEVLPIEAFGVGLGISVATLEIYQLFRPVDLFVVLFLFLAGALEMARRTAMFPLFMLQIRSIGPSGAGCYLAMILSMATRSAGPCLHYDTGLYGASAVNWLSTYPIVPGLANLHGRLGFNSSLFLWTAALYKGGLGTLSYRILGGMVVGVAAAIILAAIGRLLRGNLIPTDLFLLILTIPLFTWIERDDLVGTNTDLPSTICCLLGAYFVFQALSGTFVPHNIMRLRMVSACVLFSLAIVFKISTVIFAASSFVICIVILLSMSDSGVECRRSIFASLGLFTLIVIPWIFRGYILSGYPFYPNYWFGAAADWRVSAESTKMVALGIRAWARMRHAPISQTYDWHWVRPWFEAYRSNRVNFAVPFLIALSGAALLLLSSAQKRLLQLRQCLWLLVPSVAAVTFWFLAAPDPRFGQAAIWGTAATLGSCGFFPVVERSGVRLKLLVVTTLCLGLWCLNPRSLWRSSYRQVFKVRQFSPFPQSETKILQTRSGLEVRLPATGNQCWDAPLPCTPYFNNELELRRQGNLQSGFRAVDFPQGAEWVVGKHE